MKTNIIFTFVAISLVFCNTRTFSQAFDPAAPHLVYQSPEMSKVAVKENQIYKTINDTTRNFDIYYPSNYKINKSEPLPVPVVIFMNVGNPAAPDWNIYKDWAKAMAINGIIGINYQSYQASALRDGEDLITYLRQNAFKLGIDADKMGIWACSANVNIGLPLVMQPNRNYIRCAAFYYGITPNQAITRQDIHLQIVKAGADGYNLNQGIDAFVKKAIDAESKLEFINYLEGPHAFDAFTDTERSRQVVQQTLAFFKNHLLGNHLPSEKQAIVWTAKKFREQALTSNNPEEIIIQIQQEYQKIQQQPAYMRFYNRVVDEDLLVGIGYELLNQNKTEAAIKYFQLGTELYPASPNAFDSLAEAHEKAGNIEKALQATQKAQALMANFQHFNQNFVNQLRQSIEDKLKRLKQ
ncbi:MAG: hypothetical protein SFU99_14585 [Saprospiraceae bacterium]|nr:hypothetical protein [Saprospiraceae bacterium]